MHYAPHLCESPHQRQKGGELQIGAQKLSSFSCSNKAFLVECDCELVALNNIFMIAIELYTSWQLHSISIPEVILDCKLIE